MPVDLSPYKVIFDEVSDDQKFDNLLTALEGYLNNVGLNTQWAAGEIFAPSKLIGYAAAAADATKYLDGTGNFTIPGASNALARKITPKTVTSNVETDLLNGEFTIPANTLNGKLAALTMFCDFKNSSGVDRGVPQFKVKLFGTTLIDTGTGVANSVASSANRYPLTIEVWLQGIGPTAQIVTLRFAFEGNDGAGNGNALFAVGAGLYYCNQVHDHHFTGRAIASTAIDTTVARLLELTVTHPTNDPSFETKLYAATLVVT